MMHGGADSLPSLPWSPVPSGSIEGRVNGEPNGARRCASSKAAGLPRVDIRTILPYSANAFGGTSLRACSTGSSCACVMRAPAADRVPTGPRGVCTYAYATSPRLHVQARVRQAPDHCSCVQLRPHQQVCQLRPGRRACGVRQQRTPRRALLPPSGGRCSAVIMPASAPAAVSANSKHSAPSPLIVRV